MNNEFARCVRSAAIAAWWTVLLAAILVTLQWVAYLVVLSAKPGWVLAFWGPGIPWSAAQTIWINMIAIFKVCVGIMMLLAVWLTLWWRRLRHA